MKRVGRRRGLGSMSVGSKRRDPRCCRRLGGRRYIHDSCPLTSSRRLAGVEGVRGRRGIDVVPRKCRAHLSGSSSSGGESGVRCGLGLRGRAEACRRCGSLMKHIPSRRLLSSGRTIRWPRKERVRCCRRRRGRGRGAHTPLACCWGVGVMHGVRGGLLHLHHVIRIITTTAKRSSHRGALRGDNWGLACDERGGGAPRGRR